MKLFFFLPTIALLSVSLINCSSSGKKTSSKNNGHSYSHSPKSNTPVEKAPYELISSLRQLTYSGRRTGEGYFSADGQQIVFQSEREASNPFYQIYLTDFKTGKTKRISNGIGKTTCSWIHPSERKVLYSSTHLNPKAKEEQKKELDFRKSGKKKKYSWDYDKHYDIFAKDLKTGKTKRLTKAVGYDAEGSYSPDGKWVAFASNRLGYSSKLSPEDKKMFDRNTSHMMDIYIMKSDGTGVKRLTTSPGYDGGPFFSPDGKRITWRRFSPDGHKAEIYTMNIDGSDQRKITNLNTMSWAPYYHPSGDYIVFNTNIHGYHNFELYIVDTTGNGTPVRVTFKDGFDGLPVFLPNGHQIAWTRRKPNGESQIYIGDWDDKLARKLLNLPMLKKSKIELSPQIVKDDIESMITFLASKSFKGRATGSAEEKRYTKKLADIFKSFKLKAAGEKNSYFQNFKFLSQIEPGKKSSLSIKRLSKEPLVIEKDWAPLPFSKTGSFKINDVVFAGYGISAPKTDELAEYNSYLGLDVKDKWVLVFRYVPEDVTNKVRQHLYRYSRLHHKVMIARQNGAKGVIIVNGPEAPTKTSLVKIKGTMALAETSLPVISISNEVAQKIFDLKKKSMSELQKSLDKGNLTDPLSFDHLYLTVNVDLIRNYSTGRNVLALLKVPGAKKTLIIGAHGDHLGEGRGKTYSSLAKSTDTDLIHYGADDNASGVSGVVELAHYFSAAKKDGLIKPKQNILFAVWSGEELGNLGSSEFVKTLGKKYQISTYLNMDMIGRFEDKVSVQGIGSSSQWTKLLDRLSFQNKLPIQTQSDPYLPTDSISFYIAGHPTINFFTGAHEDYHTPHDTVEKINFEKTHEIISYIKDMTSLILAENMSFPYNKIEKSAANKGTSRGFRIFLGTIPDYTREKIQGVALSGIIKGGPAEKAGLKRGDIIVNLDTYKIENIYDYVYSLQAIKPGKETNITILRNNEKVDLKITPLLRE